MKITDIVANYIIESSLFEMAFKRKVVVDKVRNFQLQIARHLIIHLYYNVREETKSDLRSEIDTWLNDIDDYRLKNNKKLDGYVYYQLLFIEPLEERVSVEMHINKINVGSNMKPKQGLISIGMLHESVEKVLHAVAYDISNNSLKDIKYYLDNLLT